MMSGDQQGMMEYWKCLDMIEKIVNHKQQLQSALDAWGGMGDWDGHDHASAASAPAAALAALAAAAALARWLH